MCESLRLASSCDIDTGNNGGHSREISMSSSHDIGYKGSSKGGSRSIALHLQSGLSVA